MEGYTRVKEISHGETMINCKVCGAPFIACNSLDEDGNIIEWKQNCHCEVDTDES